MPLGGNLYIFGDSLSDDGATATQTGQEPVSFPFGGRASNGLVWHEYIRNDLAAVLPIWRGFWAARRSMA